MQYNLYCTISDSNIHKLLMYGFSPEIVNGLLYIASWLDETQFNIVTHQMQGTIEGLMVSSSKLSIKEESKKQSEMRIQYIQGRWNREFYNVFI